MSTATVLATIPAETPGRRLQIVFMSRSDGQSVIGLREQDHAEGLGWFVQRSFELDPYQVRALREVLGMTDRVTSTSAVRPVILAFPESQPVCADQSSPAHGPSWDECRFVSESAEWVRSLARSEPPAVRAGRISPDWATEPLPQGG